MVLFRSMVSHSLGLFPAGKPSSRFTDPEMADSSPSSRTLWSCSLFASRHRSALFPRWPIPVHVRALAGAAPSSQAGIPAAPHGHLPAVAHPLGLLPLHQLSSSSLTVRW